jgi:hypothetical protein
VFMLCQCDVFCMQKSCLSRCCCQLPTWCSCRICCCLDPAIWRCLLLLLLILLLLTPAPAAPAATRYLASSAVAVAAAAAAFRVR